MPRVKLSEQFRRPPAFMTIEPYLREQDAPIASHPEARLPRIVPLVVLDYGSVAGRIKGLRHTGRFMRDAIVDMVRGARSIRENPYTGQTRIDANTLAELEEYARELGVAGIGYAVVNPRYIFAGFRILFPNAIVFTIEMDKVKIKTAPSMLSYLEIWRTYYEVGAIVNKVADFLRERGFNAHAGPAIGGDVNYIPLARDAGLGESGKNGLLITEANGPRVRLAAVYTDIENLPFSGPDNEHAWIREYCQSCNICVEKCPAAAIFPEIGTHADGGPVFIDHTLCAGPFSNDNGCTLCIKHCPFSYGEYERMRERFMTHRRAVETFTYP